jgi:hypothetical protein
MNDPDSVNSESESDVERLLLRAGRAGAPASAKRRALLVASGATAASTLAAEGASAAAKAGSAFALKWVGVVGLTAAGAAMGTVGWHEAHAVDPTAAAVVRPAPEPVARSTPRAAAVAPPSAVFPAPSAAAIDEPRRPVTPPPSPLGSRQSSPPLSAPLPSSSSGLPRELAMLDRARAALAEGDPALALSMIDAYFARFERPELAPEATVLAIQALVRAGDRDAARRRASAFLAANPSSPYAARVRSMLTDNP